MKRALFFSVAAVLVYAFSGMATARAQTFDQDIVLLDKLKIVSMSNTGFPSTIVALADADSVCKQYDGELDESPSQVSCEYGRFEVEITSKTVIRNKDGTRRTGNIFLVGDAIRVYGVASTGATGTKVKANAARDLGPALLVAASVSVTTQSSTQPAFVAPQAQPSADDMEKQRQLANSLVSMRILLDRMLSGLLGR